MVSMKKNNNLLNILILVSVSFNVSWVFQFKNFVTSLFSLEEIVSILLNLEEGGEYIIKAADSENNEIDKFADYINDMIKKRVD